MRIPRVQSFQDALRVYYGNLTLGNKEIRQIFGNVGSAKAVELKKLARERMRERNIPSFVPYEVNTVAAFEAWGINVEMLEKGYQKLKRLGIAEERYRSAANP